MASFQYQFHATNIASDPLFHTGIIPHQQPMDPTPYHPSNSSNSSAADCEEEVVVGVVTETKNCRKQRSFLDSAPPTVFEEEKKMGKESKRRRRLTEVEDNPNGFVHVRARRGQQAMDSHSLAERMRRERINEKMKMLQELVPGCEKVNGRALMLDEIINYVQSLKHQVEFLSMTIASLSPIIYGFGLHLNNHCLVEPQKMDGRVATAVFSEQGTHHTQPSSYAGAVNSYSIAATSAPFLQQEQQTTIYDI